MWKHPKRTVVFIMAMVIVPTVMLLCALGIDPVLVLVFVLIALIAG